MNFGPHDCIANVLSTELSPNLSDMHFRNLFVLSFFRYNFQEVYHADFPNILIIPYAFISFIRNAQCLEVLLMFETLSPYDKI